MCNHSRPFNPLNRGITQDPQSASESSHRRCKVTTTDQLSGAVAEPAEGQIEAEPLCTLRRGGFRSTGSEVFVGLNMSHEWAELKRRPAAARVLRVGDAVHVLQEAVLPPV